MKVDLEFNKDTFFVWMRNCMLIGGIGLLSIMLIGSFAMGLHDGILTALTIMFLGGGAVTFAKWLFDE